MGRYVRKRKTVTDEDFTILMDDREVGRGKTPWKLPWDVKVKRLSVGDYSIDGLEKLVAIEKKRGLDELFRDLTSVYRPTFTRFLAKMKDHPVRCIVVGESLSAGRVNKTLAQMKFDSNGKCRMTPRTIYYWVGEIMCEYGVPILFLERATMELVLPEVFRAAYQRAKSL